METYYGDLWLLRNLLQTRPSILFYQLITLDTLVLKSDHIEVVSQIISNKNTIIYST